MNFIVNSIIDLTKQLLPTGRAFRMSDGSFFRGFVDGLVESEVQAENDLFSLYNFIFPDNEFFLEDDALAWERALGLVTNLDTNLEDRKLAIVRKLNHPGTIKTRANYRYIESQLRSAGFDVRIFENRFDDGNGNYVTKTVSEVAISNLNSRIQHGSISHGSSQHGQTLTRKIANSIDPNIDLVFDTGETLGHTFFISSSVLGVNAVISASRLVEFRKLVLTLKPVHTVAFAFVDVVEDIINFTSSEDGSLMLQEDENKIII